MARRRYQLGDRMVVLSGNEDGDYGGGRRILIHVGGILSGKVEKSHPMHESKYFLSPVPASFAEHVPLFWAAGTQQVPEAPCRSLQNVLDICITWPDQLRQGERSGDHHYLIVAQQPEVSRSYAASSFAWSSQ